MERKLLKGKRLQPGITLLTGGDLAPYQTSFCFPELADPYATQLQDSTIISGTAQYYLKFSSVQDIQLGGPYQIIWNDFYYADGTPMEGGRYYAHSWDMKPVLWTVEPTSSEVQSAHLWDASKDKSPPYTVWYGGHMRPQGQNKVSNWPQDNFSRDVFAFIEKSPGRWFSMEDSIFSRPGAPPRATGNFQGHRYGHQIVMTPKQMQGEAQLVASVFYEEVTEVRPDGLPAVTKIFMDEMETPFQTRRTPMELISPIHPGNGKPYPSAVREDGSALVEGPLYFRFKRQEEAWEAIGFSAGSFYSRYSASFASRKVEDGLQGKPYQLDLNDDGTDLHNAGAQLGKILNLAGGPGRPAVIIGSDGWATLGPKDSLQILVHGYRKDILPDHDFNFFPLKYRLDQMFRAVIYATLRVDTRPNGTLHFEIEPPVTPD